MTLRLALFVDGGAVSITVADYLDSSAGERDAVSVSPAETTFSHVVDGVERFAPPVAMGPLGPLVRQFRPAADRLRRGRMAAIRQAGMGGRTTGYLLFEPDDDAVLVSLAVTEALPEAEWFPDGPHAAGLYEHLERHRDELVEAGSFLRPQHVERASVVGDLVREATLGRRAVALLGDGGR